MNKQEADNEIYNHYGERWYTAYDDPVALLRAENRAKEKWILGQIALANQEPSTLSVLDVACGAGFLSNSLAEKKFTVTGVDLSESSLDIAKKHDATGTVKYVIANASALPFEAESFSVVCCLDFLEHVSNPEQIVSECARVLKSGGLFFFHTFNRNPLSRLIVIKGVEWTIRNTPNDLHVYHWFIKPKELSAFCKRAGLDCVAWIGLRPQLSRALFQLIRTGVVPSHLEFVTTSSLALSYLGLAKKN